MRNCNSSQLSCINLLWHTAVPRFRLCIKFAKFEPHFFLVTKLDEHQLPDEEILKKIITRLTAGAFFLNCQRPSTDGKILFASPQNACYPPAHYFNYQLGTITWYVKFKVKPKEHGKSAFQNQSGNSQFQRYRERFNVGLGLPGLDSFEICQGNHYREEEIHACALISNNSLTKSQANS